jgi:hypothetical protein
VSELHDTVTRGSDLSGAVFSMCDRYRYRLWRVWDNHKPRIVWVMLNPSTADESVLDPTLRRVDDYSKRWGFGGFEVVNLFAWRATDPRDLRECPVPVGPVNNSQILDAANVAACVVAGWGATSWRFVAERRGKVSSLLLTHGHDIYCLRKSKSGHPVHPLYQPANLTMQPLVTVAGPTS